MNVARILEPTFTRALSPLARHRPFDPRALALEHASLIERAARHCAKPGALVLMFGHHTRYMGWFECRSGDRGAPRTVIVGRHGSCDVRLSRREPLAALRHCGIWVRARAEGGPRIDVLDFQTNAGLGDAQGAVFRSASTEERLLFAIGKHVLWIQATR